MSGASVSPPGATRPLLSTYRLQLHAGFGFAAARSLLPYLERLGVSHLYLSPILRAHRGSTHGYDVTDPTMLNPELGTPEEFDALATEAAERGMGLIVDFVPNHMAVSAENPYWVDVLEYGESSRFASFFDIDWSRRLSARSRILVPCLGRPYGRALDAGQLQLERGEDGFWIRYYDRRFPLNPRTWTGLFSRGRHGIEAGLDPEHPGVALLRQITSLLEQMPFPLDPESTGPRAPGTSKQAALLLLERLRTEFPDAWRVVEENIAVLNGTPGEPHSFDALHELLEVQAWRAAYWRVATESVGYRRFFDINDLIGVRQEVPEVFDLTHGLIFELIAAGRIDGLRLDHVDGLLNPGAYLARLRSELEARAPRLSVFVEKILAGDEEVPASWPVDGTTGYEKLRRLNDVFVLPEGFQTLEEAFRRIKGRDASFAGTVRGSKGIILQEVFAGEMEGLTTRLLAIAGFDRYARHLLRRALEPALEEITISLPTYRTYVHEQRRSAADQRRIMEMLRFLERRPDTADPELRQFLRGVFLGEPALPYTEEQAAEILAFVQRWQQLTGPVTAKGLEDTAHYRHTPLLSCNEVGSESEPSPFPVRELHRFMAASGERFPASLTATSTHDTKRSEDVRARICVLSELASEWIEGHARWRKLAASETAGSDAAEPAGGGSPAGADAPPAREPVDPAGAGGPAGRERVDPAEDWYLFQTLLGAWPLSEDELPAFAERIRLHMRKAAREARLYTSWHDPDEAHESALLGRVTLLLGEGGAEFRRDFGALQRKVAWYGALNSLSQTALKIAAPGTPDFYQGTETWSLSLVDPDNRRPVDFDTLARQAEDLARAAEKDRGALCAGLLRRWTDGRVKLYLTQIGLRLRREHPALFRDGEYIRLMPAGSRAQHLVAFCRRLGGDWLLVAAPRLFSSLAPVGTPPLGADIWEGTEVPLPPGAPRRWRSEIDGRTVTAEGGEETDPKPPTGPIEGDGKGAAPGADGGDGAAAPEANGGNGAAVPEGKTGEEPARFPAAELFRSFPVVFLTASAVPDSGRSVRAEAHEIAVGVPVGAALSGTNRA